MNHAEAVISGILHGARRDRLAKAQASIVPQHFADATMRALFEAIERYYTHTGAIINTETLRDMLERSHIEPAKVLLYEQAHARLSATPVEDHSFRWALEGLRELRAELLTGEAVATAGEILQRPTSMGGIELQGARDAREYLYSQLASIDKLDNPEASPEGDMRHERDEILQEYQRRKDRRHSSGVFTGIQPIDMATFGIEDGELGLICAYTSSGKTQFCSQWAWDAAIKQGKNVMFATSETSRATVRRRILSRHSRLPQFNTPEGIDSKGIKHAILSTAEERTLRDVIDDMTGNPAYGMVHIVQIPRGAKLGFIEARFNRLLQNTGVDIMFIDYLTLIRPDLPRASSREELNDVLRDTKMLAVGAAEGKGVPIVSPWQMGQRQYEAALKSGAYGLGSLSETSEAEKTPDLIVSMLRLPDAPSQIKFQHLKLRDAETGPPITLEVDFRTSYLAPRQEAQDLDNLLGDD